MRSLTHYLSAVARKRAGLGGTTLWDNLVAYWPLDESSDGSVPVDRTDLVGSLVLSDSNTTASTTGKIGNAALFVNSNSEALNGADWAAVDFTGDVSFTIAAWVNLTTVGGDRVIIAKWQVAANGRQYQLSYANAATRFRFDVRDSGDAAGVTVDANNFGAPSTGTWYLVVVRRNAADDTISISVNAGTPDSASQTAGVASTTQSFRVGRNTGGTYMNGAIDEILVWNVHKTDSEITELYNGGSGTTPP